MTQKTTIVHKSPVNRNTASILLLVIRLHVLHSIAYKSTTYDSNMAH